jgi:hypothetical protein
VVEEKGGGGLDWQAACDARGSLALWHERRGGGGRSEHDARASHCRWEGLMSGTRARVALGRCCYGLGPIGTVSFLIYSK